MADISNDQSVFSAYREPVFTSLLRCLCVLLEMSELLLYPYLTISAPVQTGVHASDRCCLAAVAVCGLLACCCLKTCMEYYFL